MNDLNRLAAQAVALHAPGDAHDKRELLEALGLLTDDGRGIRPDGHYIHLDGLGDFTNHRGDAA